MLLRLIVTRFCPVAAMGIIKDRKQMKRALFVLVVCYMLGMILATWKVMAEEKWLGFVCILISLFPQYIFYGFAIWSLIRCIWHSWSERVWKRVHLFSMIVIFLGIFTEIFVNEKILQIFFKIFKELFEVT